MSIQGNLATNLESCILRGMLRFQGDTQTNLATMLLIDFSSSMAEQMSKYRH